ncbi:hypothetical protein ABZ379_48845 [Streptomyces canus]|uniref:hypothetical protein n=1 Tax=Streptomyces canus TaxID=58343 RepID=UPI003409CF7A
MTRDEEAIRARTVAVDVVRLTPLQDGTPAHHLAATFTPRHPLHLMVAAIYPAPNLALNPLEDRGPYLIRMVAALATTDDHEEQHLPLAMDRHLYQHAPNGAAVETWTAERATRPTRPRLWLYNLLPRWTWTPPDKWPLEEPPTTTIHTMGKIHPNPTHHWPTPHPYAQGSAVDLDSTHCLTAITQTPPPSTDPALTATGGTHA